MEDPEPPRKRLKSSKSIKENSSEVNKQLFAPFRALGFITNHVPFAMQVRSFKGATGAPRVHIVTCLGKSWAEFEGEKMKLLFVGKWLVSPPLFRLLNYPQGPDTKHPITSVVLDGDHVLVTAGPDIIRYTAGKEVKSVTTFHMAALSFYRHLDYQVLLLQAFPQFLCLALSCLP